MKLSKSTSFKELRDVFFCEQHFSKRQLRVKKEHLRKILFFVNHFDYNFFKKTRGYIWKK